MSPGSSPSVSQPDARSLAGHTWDAVVVGGGPAGSAAALVLAREGRTVLVVDRFRFPRDKACGDGLIPDALRVLEHLGLRGAVEAVAQPVDTLRAFSPSRHEVTLPGDFLVLPRRRLDSLLLLEAAAAGAVPAQGMVEGVRERSDGVELSLRGSPNPLRARTVLLATGADVRLLRELGTPVAPAHGTAIRTYIRSPERVHGLVFAYDRPVIPGYGWIFPTRLGGREAGHRGVEPLPPGHGAPELHEYNVGVILLPRPGVRPAPDTLDRLLDRFFEAFPEARTLLSGGERIGAPRGARLRCGLNPAAGRPGRRILAAGDAIDAIFPFSGEGIGKALETGAAAGGALARFLGSGDEAELAGYRTFLEDEVAPKYHGYRVAERWLSRPWLNDLLAARATRSRALREAAAGIIGESVDPRTVFSPGGLWRSLVG